jgi:hypothetical protein
MKTKRTDQLAYKPPPDCRPAEADIPSPGIFPAVPISPQRIIMNRVLAHIGARYPIVQAPMGWIARTRLASAVSRAGGLGIIEETAAQFFAITGGLATEHKFG